MYVEFKNINKKFGNYEASKDISFGIEKGKLIGLLGPSGSGKTTILRMIAGLESPDSGDIFIDGVRVNDIEPSKRGIGFVFQSYALFKYMNVFDNIAFGLEVQKQNKREIKERVSELIKLIGLEGLEKRYPSELSGGQRQRVAFARALAPKPQLLLLDEPFAAIDAKVRQELRNWLKDMITKVGVTSIFVTHDQDEAIEVADEIIITNKGQLEQKGSAYEIYKQPLTPFVAEFIGQSTFLEDYNKFKGFSHMNYGEKAVIRPEFIKVTKTNEQIEISGAVEQGVIEKVSFRGNYTEIKINVNNVILTATRSVEKEPMVVGEKVKVIIYCLYLFKDGRSYLVENSWLKDNNSVFI